jgi:hypothetical protein
MVSLLSISYDAMLFRGAAFLLIIIWLIPSFTYNKNLQPEIV